MKIFAHDGMVINLESIASVEKHFTYNSVMKKVYYLRFEFINKNSISTSYFYEENVVDEWLEEIAETMRKSA